MIGSILKYDVYTTDMITIRYADQPDINALSSLARLCFSDTFGHLYSKKNLSEHLQTTCSSEFFAKSLSEDKILLAEDGNQLVGYIKFGEVNLPLQTIPDSAKEIQRLYIHPQFKGNGIGRNLMQHALNHSTLKTSKHLYLSVYEGNIKAQNFYKKYEFSIIGEYNYYVGSHIDREFIMHKKNTD